MKGSGLSFCFGKYNLTPAVFIIQVLLISAVFLTSPARGEEGLPSLFGLPLDIKYTATAVSEHLSGRVGEPILLSFTLDPPGEPMGSFLTVNLSEQKSPDNVEKNPPKVLTGFPDTRMMFSRPGVYRYGVVVSLIAKGSCAGVQADHVYKGVVTVDVRP